LLDIGTLGAGREVLRRREIRRMGRLHLEPTLLRGICLPIVTRMLERARYASRMHVLGYRVWREAVEDCFARHVLYLERHRDLPQLHRFILILRGSRLQLCHYDQINQSFSVVSCGYRKFLPVFREELLADDFELLALGAGGRI
jgi:hypothetical protein